jgi:hypothetical protein
MAKAKAKAKPKKKPKKKTSLAPAPGSEWLAVQHPDDVPAYPIGTALWWDESATSSELHHYYVKVAPDAWAVGYSYTEKDAWKALVQCIDATYRCTDSELRLRKFTVLSEGWKVRQYVIDR